MLRYNEKPYEEGSPYHFQLTLDHILKAGVCFAPDKEIVYRDLVRYDYRTLLERVNRLAGALVGLGVKPGDTVAVLDWDSHRYLECFFAIPMIGAVLHTVNIRLSPEEITYTMNHAEDLVVLVFSDFLPVLEGVSSKLKTVQKFVLMSDSGDKPSTSLPLVGEYEALLANAPTVHQFPVLDENTEATIFYTTGTTGLPKGVHFTHRQLTLHTLVETIAFGSYASPGRFRSDDVYMPLTPLFHAHAWGFPYTATMIGTKQVYPGRYEPETIVRLIEREGVTFSHCVHTILRMILTTPAVQTADLSQWKVIVGGGPLPRGLAQTAQKLGVHVNNAYGLSETCPLISTANLKEHMLGWENERRLDVLLKAGFPVVLSEARVVDPAGNDLPRDNASTGELLLRAPWLTKDYYKDEERTRALWTNGWMHTGDVAYLDTDGYINITDRLKDVIKSGGEWISSLALEDLLSQLKEVAEVAVVGVPDDKWGERPAAFIVLKPESRDSLTRDGVRAYLEEISRQGRISKWAIPDRIEFVPSIPKTSVGKIAKRELRAQYAK